jgi:RNA polymerase sigma-70 factor (ECF subfamily)
MVEHPSSRRLKSGTIVLTSGTLRPLSDMEVATMSDSELWLAARSGDPDAFGALFDRHSRAIYNYCFRRVGNWAAAEDLLSVVFLEAWRRRDIELPEGMVLPWLYGVATNVIRNAARSQRRYRRALERIPRPEPTPDFSTDSDARLDDEAAMGEVLSLVGQLRQEEQDVFWLCGWSELSYEQAAIALQVPVGTVRSRLSRARASLRELGAEFGHEERRTLEPETKR